MGAVLLGHGAAVAVVGGGHLVYDDAIGGQGVVQLLNGLLGE